MKMGRPYIHSMESEVCRRRPNMLIYFMPQCDQAVTPEFLRARAKAVALIRTWESARLPLAFVGQSWFSNRHKGPGGLGRPLPGDLLFVTDAPSLLRDRNFQSLDEDLGTPNLLLAGGTIEGKILPTTVDAFMSGRPVFVASETLFLQRCTNNIEYDVTRWRDVISNYARLSNNMELFRDRR